MHAMVPDAGSLCLPLDLLTLLKKPSDLHTPEYKVPVHDSVTQTAKEAIHTRKGAWMSN
jgi:hypothetical protein